MFEIARRAFFLVRSIIGLSLCRSPPKLRERPAACQNQSDGTSGLAPDLTAVAAISQAVVEAVDPIDRILVEFIGYLSNIGGPV